MPIRRRAARPHRCPSGHARAWAHACVGARARSGQAHHVESDWQPRPSPAGTGPHLQAELEAERSRRHSLGTAKLEMERKLERAMADLHVATRAVRHTPSRENATTELRCNAQ